MDVLFLFVLGSFLYFIPVMVAFERRHPSKVAILVLNIFLGWTFLGWVAALVWAFYGEKGPSVQEQAAQIERARRRVLLVGEDKINADGTARQEIIAELGVGARIYLKHVKDQPRDPLKILALSEGEQIGTLPPSAVEWKRGIAQAGEAMATVVSVERLPSGLLGVEVEII